MDHFFASNAISFASAYFISDFVLPRAAPKFIQNGLFGKDLHKKEKPQVPESMGTVVLVVYMNILIFLMPFELPKESIFIRYLAAILSIQASCFLGFVDDVLELKWRHKLFMPLLASLPLIMIYYLQSNITYMSVPYYGPLDIGILYYVYMIMFTIFCTNSINILAGINGLEVGQSIVIASFILLYSSIQAYYYYMIEFHQSRLNSHKFTISIILPFIGASFALLKYNIYPAKMFCGDAYTYTSGMICAICGILSHTSKTLILFFIPQILNFLISLPQILRVIPCPKHRLPRFVPEENLLYYGTVAKEKEDNLFDKKGKSFGEFLNQFKSKNACHLNFINIVLFLKGPMSEHQLFKEVMKIQIICCGIGLAIRYSIGFLIEGLPH
eukprot:NODE_303_length_10328_cov_1.228077.p5 type:complete len:385 gc:universal NODE_303_length_10328_cov_1.228077:8311-9465(+)